MDNFNSTLASLENMSFVIPMGNDTMDNFNSTLASLENMGNDTMENFISPPSVSLENIIDMVTAYIELPVIFWAAFALYHQVKANNVTPVYVINLLISDIIQIIGRLMYLHGNYGMRFAGIELLYCGLVASVLFMMCIALERYLVVVHPLWYRCHRTIKHSVLISLAVCAFEALLLAAEYYSWNFLSFDVTCIGVAFFLILPLPILAFFLGATWKALSHSISVPHKEKKRILGTLTLVLLIYLVMFFPSILLPLYTISPGFFDHYNNFAIIRFIAYVSLSISPLMDPLLYIIIKKDDSYTLKVPHCCRRLCAHKESRETSTENLTSV